MILRLRRALLLLIDDEAGDVPGWVLITLMTAGLLVVTNMGYSKDIDWTSP